MEKGASPMHYDCLNLRGWHLNSLLVPYYFPNLIAQLPILLHLYELGSLQRNELQVVQTERTTTKTAWPLQSLKNKMPSTASNINCQAPSYLYLITAFSDSFFTDHFSPAGTYRNFSMWANNFTIYLRFELFSRISVIPDIMVTQVN